MGLCCSQEDNGPQNAIGNDSSTQDSEALAPVELPAGWKAVPSRSRPGKVTFMNVHTGERISWVPTEEAKTYKGGISKKKKKKAASGSATNGGSAAGADQASDSNGKVKPTNSSHNETMTPA